MTIKVSKAGKVPVISVAGEVDLYSSPDLRKELKKHIKKKHKLLVIDLAGVEYMDSSGVATLIEGHQGLAKVGGRLRLAGLTPAVMQVLKFVHLEKVFDIVGDVEEAIEE